jgi:hypothetical protein
MKMTRSTDRGSLSQRLELGCYEPSAHGRQAVTGSAGVGCGREPWNVMRERICVNISASVDGDAVNLLSEKVRLWRIRGWFMRLV